MIFAVLQVNAILFCQILQVGMTGKSRLCVANADLAKSGTLVPNVSGAVSVRGKRDEGLSNHGYGKVLGNWCDEGRSLCGYIIEAIQKAVRKYERQPGELEQKGIGTGTIDQINE